jgi:hypothetical protein
MSAEANILGFVEPDRWAFDGGLRRREPVRDALNENRVVRYCGYRRCLTCSKVAWTEDVCAMRVCQNCKKLTTD